MSLRATLAILLLVVGCAWTFRRPFIGVCMVVTFFQLNLRSLGAGLEEIRFQFVCTLVLVLSYIFHREELNARPNQTYPSMRVLFAFTAITFITSAWAVASVDLAFDSAVDFSKIVLFAWLASKIVKTEKEMTILMYVIFAGMAYTSFMAAWGVEWDWIDDVEVGIATGGTGTHLMMFMPLLLLLVLYGKWWEKIYCALVIPLVLNFLPNAPEGSRSTLVILATAIVCMLIFSPGAMRFRIIVPVIAGGLIFIFFLTPADYWIDMATILNPRSEGSAESRFIINEATFKIVHDYPMGIGYNNYSSISMRYLPEDVLTDFGTRDAHNSYLKVLAEFGYAGLIVWLLIFAVTWWDFRRIRKTLVRGVRPTRLQLYALAFETGLLGIVLGIATHSYNDLDTLYWFVAFSGIMRNIHEQQTETAASLPTEKDAQGSLPNQIPEQTKQPAPVAA